MNIEPCSKPGLTQSCMMKGVVVSILLTMAAACNTVQAGSNQTANQAFNTDLKTRSGVTLQRWLNKNVDNHPSVLAAIAAVDSSRYQLIAADKALYNPELELDAESAAADTASIGLSQTIDWGDSRGARTEMAASNKVAVQFAYESTRRNIAAEFLSGLSEYHTSSALKILAEQGESLMQRSAKLAKQRFDAGDLGKVEVDLSNLSYAQARFKLADAITLHARAKQNLIALTGSINTNWPEPLDNYPAPENSTPEVSKIVQQLPKMREITSRVKAAQANIKLQAGEGTVNPTIAFRAGKEDQDTLIGLSLSIPLQIRNNFKAQVDSANAEMIQAERESIDAYRKLKSRLEIAIISYELSREAWVAWQQSGADTLNEQIKLLERLWEAGEMNTTDYLIQLTQTLETKASAIEQRGRMWTDWSEWLIASGKIEQWLNKAPANNTREQ